MRETTGRAGVARVKQPARPDQRRRDDPKPTLPSCPSNERQEPHPGKHLGDYAGTSIRRRVCVLGRLGTVFGQILRHQVPYP